MTLEARTYDVATTRMTARAGNTYSYDRAGNLDSATVGSAGWKYIYATVPVDLIESDDETKSDAEEFQSSVHGVELSVEQSVQSTRGR